MTMIALLSRDEFAARRRDPLLEYDDYETKTRELLRRIPSAARNLANPQWLQEHDEGRIMQMTRARVGCTLDLLTLAYSAGAEADVLAAFYPVLLAWCEEYAHYSDAYNKTPIGSQESGPHLALGDVDFHSALRLLCYAILLGHEETVSRVMAILDYGNTCKDGLLERLAARYVERPAPAPATCLRGLPYARTLAIFDEPASERPQLMHDYLTGWYKASRREPYHGRDAKPDFLGYWSWEAAAITRVLGIDDEAYRDLPFYPRDLAEYGGRSAARDSGGGDRPTPVKHVPSTTVTSYDPSRHIACDYKRTGSELLNLMRCEFDHTSLDSVELDELAGELANELAGDCLGPLATQLAPAGLQVWEIDFYEDTLYVALVTEDEVPAFEQYWRVDYLNEPDATHFAPRLRRVKPRPFKGSKAKSHGKPQPAAAPRAQPKTGMVVDTITLHATPTVDIERSISLLRSPHSDHPDNGKYFDFAVWPPRPLSLSLPRVTGDIGSALVWLPVHCYLHRNIWACHDPADRVPGVRPGFRLAQLYDIDGLPPVWLGGGATLARSDTDPKWIHDVMLHVSQSNDERGRPIHEVIRVTKTECEVWYRSHLPLQAFPFPDAVRCLIVEDGKALAIADGPITGTDFLRLSKPLYRDAEGVIALEGSTVVYFTAAGAALRMHRLDLDTREESTALLAGFGHRGKIDGKPHVSFGNLFIRQGHEDWWILNHKSNQFGKIDIALLWNARTNETIRIEQQDIALHQPTVLYQRSLGRYLALSGDTVALLCEFDALYAGKEKRTLRWEAAD